MEAVGAVAEQSDLVVGALGQGVGDAVLEEGADAVEAAADGAAEPDEGRQAGARGPCRPSLDWFERVVSGDESAEHIEQRFLEEVGTPERLIGSERREQVEVLLGDGVAAVECRPVRDSSIL